jgi:hypothetical protein
LKEAVRAGFTLIGETTDDGHLTITNRDKKHIWAKIEDLKPIWKAGLVPYY